MLPRLMSLISGQQLCKTYGTQVVLDRVDVTVEAEDRIGLVGANGSGKSTLGRILAGLEVPDLGTVAQRRGARIAYLAQEPTLPAGSALEVTVQGLQDWHAAKQRHDSLAQALAAHSGDLETLLAEQGAAAAQIEHLGGWDVTHRAEDLLARLSIFNLDQDVSTMSGGEKRRVALARLLIGAPDVAILDEPTNHLDANTIEWLETYLQESFKGALLLITHDRYVLDRVVNRTLELERGQVHSYEGGWERYLAAKAERQEFLQRTEANRSNFLRKELEWLQRQPKARTTKQKARIKRAEETIAAPQMQSASNLNFEAQSGRLGSTILEFSGLHLGVGDKTLIKNLDLKLIKGERLGIIGPNGCGKSSLFRAIVGQLTPLAGSIVLGKNSDPAYFDQNRSGLIDDETILQNIAGKHDSVQLGEQSLSVYSYLERFAFRGERMRTKVGALSGGERARVALAKLLLQRGNLLLLDEPTNDLDVQTLSALEEMLIDFKGVTLVVTHDRYFLNRVATSILAFEGQGQVARYAGNYDDYLLQRQQTRAAGAIHESPSRESTKARPRAKPKGLSFSEARELEQLLPTIDGLESEIGRLEALLANPETYSKGSDAARNATQEVEQARAALEQAMVRWEELETKRSPS
ncbi:MAG TPA: ABC-F family ATP-binding cassette domain-containing protein [Polyangiaceae bacterium]|nr:ABC-F family ATP-binding cassette domain-containing protein [Polyangiaceae bacterium]